MKAVPLNDNVYWVGVIDWHLRSFHGYLTQRGSTYNAYLIIDDKITLIDTVKAGLYDEMLGRISSVVDPSKIDYIVSNHVEMDHSGSLPKIMEVAKNAKIFTSPKGEAGLKHHYKKDWDLQVVNSGDKINIGKRDLQFILTPMAHWPDNMICYSPEDKILFSNDSFGQHLATSERFDDEYYSDIIFEEAKKYYANIIMPYPNSVKKELKEAADLDIQMIATSHGIIWRKHIKEIVEEYTKWSANETDNRALIIYDTMWNSTEMIAKAIQKGFEEKGIHSAMFNLQHNHISDIMTEVLTAKYICVGSPTLNKNMLPTVAGFLTYFKGLAPKNRVGMAFGSYGWTTHGIDEVNSALESCKFDLLEPVKIQYVPDKDQLNQISNQVVSALN